jgi:hypothetical protein
MKRTVLAAAFGLGAILALGLRVGWSPLVKPAGANPARVRQVAGVDQPFAFTAIVAPGGIVTLGRAPVGLTFLVTDVLVHNVAGSGEPAEVLTLHDADRSVVTVGATTSLAPFFGRRLANGGLLVRTLGLELEEVRLTAGFMPVRGNGVDTLAVTNSSLASATALVQVFGFFIEPF